MTNETPRWSGSVRHAEHLGSDTYLYIQTEHAGELTVRIVGEAGVGIGERIGISPLPTALHRFDDADVRVGPVA